jgi:hypothetical protein
MENIQLTATLGSDDRIRVSGNGGRRLRRGSGAHVFTFTLRDDTKLGVEFLTPEEGLLVAEDNTESCPPTTNNSKQIVEVRRPSARTASFRDKNDNDQPDMPISYALHFRCTGDPTKTVEPFDPIIINGGGAH